MYTQDEMEEDLDAIEVERARTRVLVVAAAERDNPWRLDGLKAKARFDMLDEMERKARVKRVMSRISTMQRIIQQRRDRSNEQAGEFVSKAGPRYKMVTQDESIALRKQGFNTEMVGRNKWRVQES